MVDGSIQRDAGDGMVQFRLTDQAHEVPVRYHGILPDLFREGQGIVAQGVLGDDGVFTASEVLAKHDENYMPPEVADALKQAGVWRHGGAEEDGSRDRRDRPLRPGPGVRPRAGAGHACRSWARRGAMAA